MEGKTLKDIAASENKRKSTYLHTWRTAFTEVVRSAIAYPELKSLLKDGIATTEEERKKLKALKIGSAVLDSAEIAKIAEKAQANRREIIGKIFGPGAQEYAISDSLLAHLPSVLPQLSVPRKQKLSVVPSRFIFERNMEWVVMWLGGADLATIAMTDSAHEAGINVNRLAFALDNFVPKIAELVSLEELIEALDQADNDKD